MGRKKKVDPNSPKKDTPEYCVNCGKIFYGKKQKIELIIIPVKNVETFSVHDYASRERAFKVGSVLSTVYKLENDSLNLTSGCCSPCATILAHLYKFYCQFEELRQLNTELSQAISKSLLCQTQIPTNQSKITSNESPFISANVAQVYFQVEKGKITTKTNSKSDLIVNKDTNNRPQDDLIVIDSPVGIEKGPIDYLENCHDDDDFHSDLIGTVNPESTPNKVDNNLVKSNIRRRARRTFKNLECIPCQESFVSQLALNKHLRVKHGDEQFKCHTCETVFLQESWYQRHIQKCRPGQELCCTQCSKTFPPGNLERMKTHMRGHRRQTRPQLCPQCGKRFSDLQALKRHLLTHTNEKPYECEICHKFFRQKNVLARHRDLHMGYLFLCQVCGMSFGSKSNLNRHSRVHGTARPYKCKVPGCTSDFKFLSTYKAHARVHMENRPLKRKGRGLGKTSKKS